MTRRIGRVTAALLAVALGLVSLQASCGSRRPSTEGTRGDTTGSIPKRYENWVVTYSTGESKVYAKALSSAPARLLFTAEGEVDPGMLLEPLPGLSSIAYEWLRDGRVALSVFATDGGPEDRVAEDVRGPVRVMGDHLVYASSAKGGDDSLWEWDPEAGRTNAVFRAAALQCQGSRESTGGVLFSVARSDPAVDPVDQDLYYLAGPGTRPRRIASAPHEYGFSGARELNGDVYFTLLRLGGEEHGTVRVWSPKTGKTKDLASHAALLDVRPDGALLLLEPPPTQPAMALAEETPECQRLRFVGPGGSDRVLEGEYSGEPLARVFGDVVLVARHDGKEHRLDAFDVNTGERRTLHHSTAVRVSEIQPLDEHAVACVLDRIGGDGLAAESKLVWMPLDGGDPVELAKTESGFIHMALPTYCES